MAHAGSKAQKLAWIDDESFLTGGFNKQAEREYCLWDARALDQPLVRSSLGSGLGVPHLYFDR